MKKQGRMGKLNSIKSWPSVKFVDIIRASKHKMKRMRSKSGRSCKMNLGQNNSQSVVNEIPESSSILPPSTHSQHANFQNTSSMHKTSTFSKLRSKVLISKSKRRTISKQRRHKQHEIEDIGDVVRDFSNLPDCIIHHILSLMPTKEAVKTSILSTRWKNLWDSVPNLDVDATKVDDWHPTKVTSFMNFLERVLRLRGESNIKKFRLTCCDRNEESQVHAWISDAINHNVQELELCIFQGVPCIFQGVPSMIPWYILDGTSLVSLKITTTYFGELPCCFSLPCLKTLHLQFLVFLNDEQVNKLLLGCLVLEELVLLDIWMNLKNIVISNSTLKSLTIRDLLQIGAYHDPTSGCKIKIDAENLAYFQYYGFLSNKILLNNASSLVKARIDILPYQPRWQKLVSRRAVNLLKRLQFVLSLSVSETAIKYLVLAERKRDRFPIFENLSQLMLLTSEVVGNKTFGSVMDFLHSCPVLQSVCLSEGFEECMDLGEDDDSIWSSLPICVSNCLKTVTLKDFHGNDSEICFLRRVLKTACVLERMDIWWSETCLRDLKRKTKVRKELEKIERSSSACVINFL